jgi:hypothetical protein
LAAHAGFPLDRKRLSEALGKLAGRGLITEGGDDPFIGSPAAYRDRSRREASNIRRKLRNGKRSVEVAVPRAPKRGAGGDSSNAGPG